MPSRHHLEGFTLLPVGNRSEHSPLTAILVRNLDPFGHVSWPCLSSILILKIVRHRQRSSQETNLKFHVGRSPSNWGSQAYPRKKVFIGMYVLTLQLRSRHFNVPFLLRNPVQREVSIGPIPQKLLSNASFAFNAAVSPSVLHHTQPITYLPNSVVNMASACYFPLSL